MSAVWILEFFRAEVKAVKVAKVCQTVPIVPLGQVFRHRWKGDTKCVHGPPSVNSLLCGYVLRKCHSGSCWEPQCPAPDKGFGCQRCGRRHRGDLGRWSRPSGMQFQTSSSASPTR